MDGSGQTTAAAFDHLVGRGRAPGSLLDQLYEIRTFLERTSAPEALASTVTRDSVRRVLGDLVTDIDHLGFIAPPNMSTAEIVQCATEAGFGFDHDTSTSVIVATELAALRGRPVPTAIVRANASALGRKLGVEIFAPSENEDIVRGWRDAGVAGHAAFRLRSADRSTFDEVAALMADEGFRRPAFFGGSGPLALVKKDGSSFVTIYLDGVVRARPTRLEFCAIEPSPQAR